MSGIKAPAVVPSISSLSSEGRLLVRIMVCGHGWKVVLQPGSQTGPPLSPTDALRSWALSTGYAGAEPPELHHSPGRCLERYPMESEHKAEQGLASYPGYFECVDFHPRKRACR
jgi:hypothetical protein